MAHVVASGDQNQAGIALLYRPQVNHNRGNRNSRGLATSLSEEEEEVMVVERVGGEKFHNIIQDDIAFLVEVVKLANPIILHAHTVFAK